MDKSPIVLEIGSRYTKCGISPEPQPKYIIPTQFTPLNLLNYLSSGISYDENVRSENSIQKLPTFNQLSESIFTFINNIFFKYLLCKPDDRKVIIIENLNIPRLFREALVTVLFEQFRVPMIIFMNPTTTLVPLLKTTGLIVDCGYSECRVLPVVESIGLIKAYNTISMGFQTLEDELRDSLLNQSEESPLINNINYQIPDQPKAILESLISKSSTNFNVIEDIIVKTCLALPIKPSMPLPNISNTRYRVNKQYSLMIHHGYRSGLVNRLFQSESVVEEREPESQKKESYQEGNLATTILESLLQCDIDQRKALSHNILLIGGTSMIPGFKSRLLQELKLNIQSSERYKELSGLISHFDYIKHSYQPNTMMWLGASLLGSVTEHLQSKISIETFQAFPIFDGRRHLVLPEWEKISLPQLITPPISTNLNPLNFQTSLFSPFTSNTDLSSYMKNKD